MESFSFTTRDLLRGWEVEITNEKSYTGKYLKKISKLCKKREFLKGDLSGAETFVRLTTEGHSTSTLLIELRKVNGSYLSWNSINYKLVLSTDPQKNELVIYKHSSDSGTKYTLRVKGSDKVTYPNFVDTYFREELTGNVNCLYSFTRELNDRFIQKCNFGITISLLPTYDNPIGSLLSKVSCKDKFTFLSKNDDYELSIPLSYLFGISTIFDKFYNPDNVIGRTPTNTRKLNMSRYCLEVVFKKIIFGLSFSGVDFGEVCEGDFFELLSFFCEFGMEFVYTTLVSLFIRLNVSEGERSHILNCEFPKMIKDVVKVL